jgi:hypothetical protein
VRRPWIGCGSFRADLVGVLASFLTLSLLHSYRLLDVAVARPQSLCASLRNLGLSRPLSLSLPRLGCAQVVEQLWPCSCSCSHDVMTTPKTTCVVPVSQRAWSCEEQWDGRVGAW